MTYICVSIMVDTEFEALQQAERAAEAGARLVEWRVDQVAESPELIRNIINNSPLPCIVTCRPVWEGGEYDGDDSERISLFEYIGINTQPRYIDLELAAYQRSANLRQKIKLAIDQPGQLRDMDTRLILSVHDFSCRPGNLYNKIHEAMVDEACSVIKIAWMARSLRDNIEIFDLLKNRGKPMIALCMGRFGLMSRVLAPKFGGLLSFASTGDQTITAPGQPSIDVLINKYRFNSIDTDTQVYGVIGWPAEHSIGPIVHNTVFEYINHNAVYLPLPIPPEYEHFKATVGTLTDFKPLDFRGASVTLPHKQNLYSYAQESGSYIDPLVEITQAANTLVVDVQGRLSVYNTDIAAAIDSVCNALSIEADRLNNYRIAVIGAGGAARAIAVGFMLQGAAVKIYNRTHQRGLDLATFLNEKPFTTAQKEVNAYPLPDIMEAEYDILINTTPAGMAGGADAQSMPVPFSAEGNGICRNCLLVFDIIYNPEITPLLKAGQSAGCQILNGRDMFVRQALRQLELWTNRNNVVEYDYLTGITLEAQKSIKYDRTI